MTTEALLGRLRELPGQIADWEAQTMTMECRRDQLARTIEELEDEALLSGTIDGKNVECRAAQLRSLTRIERSMLADQEQAVKRAKIQLHRVQNELVAALALVRLVTYRPEGEKG